MSGEGQGAWWMAELAKKGALPQESSAPPPPPIAVVPPPPPVATIPPPPRGPPVVIPPHPPLVIDNDGDADDPWGNPTPSAVAAPVRPTGVTIEDVVRARPRQPWAPNDGEPDIVWHMPYYAPGVYEEGDRVVIGQTPSGEKMTIPVPPLLRRRRRMLANLWLQRGGIEMFSESRAPPPPAYSVTPARRLPPGPTGSAVSAASGSSYVQSSATGMALSEVPQAQGTALPAIPCRPTNIPHLVQILQPVGGMNPPCPRGLSCGDITNPDHREQWSHPCRYGDTCTAARFDEPERIAHLRNFVHPRGTIMHTGLLQRWLPQARRVASASDSMVASESAVAARWHPR